MDLIQILLLLVVVGFGLWAVNNWVPMDPKFKTVLNFIVVIALILWLLRAFGIIGHIGTLRP